MRTYHGTLTWCSAALLGIAMMAHAEPAVARSGFNAGIAGGLLGGIAGGMLRGPRMYAPRTGSGGRSSRRGRDREEREESREDTRASRNDAREDSRRTRALASLAPPSMSVQRGVLKSIFASEVLGMVGSTKDINEVGKIILRDFTDEARDYTKRIQFDIIENLLDRDNSRRAGDRVKGDVSEDGVMQSLQKAIKEAKLDTFETFIGEHWSTERLRNFVLERVSAERDRLKNNIGQIPMADLDKLMQRSAEAVYRRVFETSELIAANRSLALFLQRLYQAHGSQVDNNVRESIDQTLTEASNAAIAKFETALRRDENGFALRYRAQRIVFDCLSENVDRISSSETAMATIGEIQQNIMQTARNTCIDWLDTQFGAERDRIKPQAPYPMRVIWTATGPNDDPSMYGRTSIM
jgi:hypothetical protein